MGNKCERHFCNESKPHKLFPNWMRSISDSSLLTSLTIPGTHNSCSFFGGVIAITQTWTIPLQLKAGIRYFDIRLRRYNNKLRLQHGIMDQKCTFDIILQHFKDFLISEPTEVVIMAVQEEYKAKNSSKDMKTLFDEYISAYVDLIVEYKGRDITLGDLRGKILFINVFHSRIHWTALVKVQNDWVVNVNRNIKDKKRKIKQLFNRAIAFTNDGFIYLNYLSGVSDYGIITPSHCADETNKVVFKYKGRLGIVLCDFPGEDLIEHLIEQNSSFCPAIMDHNVVLDTNATISLMHINTGKFLSCDAENSKLVCSKQKCLFNITTKNSQSGVYDEGILKLRAVNTNTVEMTVIVIKKQDKRSSSNDNNLTPIKEKKTLSPIYKGDLIYICMKDKESDQLYLASDYLSKTNHIQYTTLNSTIDNNCEWRIDM